jgi:hypothetical protein
VLLIYPQNAEVADAVEKPNDISTLYVVDINRG